ncbi:MAG TPA: response regulator [Ktedonobacteraceae bacterium]
MGKATVSQQSAFTLRTILIVEDDEEIGVVLETLLLEEFETDVVLAQNGRQASQMVCNPSIDLILLDYHLPDINGIQLYDFWRHYFGLTDLSVIMISANPPYEELEQRHLLNVKKPFDLDNILEAVERVLTIEQRTAQHRVY